MKTRIYNLARLLPLLAAAFAAVVLTGCRKAAEFPNDPRVAAADKACRAKWGKSLADLETVELVVISANNEDILNEFEWAFSLQHAVEHGQKVRFQTRDVSGGGSSIEKYLFNIFSRGDYHNNQSGGTDVVWGGGDAMYPRLARGIDGRGPLLEKLDLDPQTLASIPQTHAGVTMYDPELRWAGSVISGFGFIYNRRLLDKCGIAAPATWDDLGDGRFAGLLQLADPTQSGSVASTYRMIALSGGEWPAGWHKLLDVLANAKQFNSSAGAAANAPVLGDSLVATCIDFYGISRVAEAPDELVYVSPQGGTAYTPDPIGVLRDPPHPELAQQFVRFVLSPRGQALWALPVGAEGGPMRSNLSRTPIRRDVFTTYHGKLLPSITDAFERQAISIDPAKPGVNQAVLTELVYAAAVINTSALAAARRAVLAKNDPALTQQFYALPPEVDTPQKMALVAGELRDKAKLDDLRRHWRRFFEQKYRAARG